VSQFSKKAPRSAMAYSNGIRSQILQLDPPEELTFRGSFRTEEVIVKFTITNPTCDRVAFKIKTTFPKYYWVRPNYGVLQAKSIQEISIGLQPLSEYELAVSYKHKFMVQSLCVNEDFMYHTNDDVMSAMRGANKQDLMESKLRCVFVHEPVEGEDAKININQADARADPTALLFETLSKTQKEKELVMKESEQLHQEKEQLQLENERLRRKVELLTKEKNDLQQKLNVITSVISK
jgi:hypothetical protein